MWRRAACRALALRAPLSRRISGDALSRKAIATPATVGKIDALQQYLQQSGMTGVTVLTPERVYLDGECDFTAFTLGP